MLQNSFWLGKMRTKDSAMETVEYYETVGVEMVRKLSARYRWIGGSDHGDDLCQVGGMAFCRAFEKFSRKMADDLDGLNRLCARSVQNAMINYFKKERIHRDRFDSRDEVPDTRHTSPEIGTVMLMEELPSDAQMVAEAVFRSRYKLTKENIRSHVRQEFNWSTYRANEAFLQITKRL